MSLKIYSTLSRQTEEFKPLTPGEVKIYVCGPTVYNFLHVGNFRGVVFFNLVRNWLEELGYKVQYALNFTDVDDKIIARANEMGKSAGDVSELYIAEYKKDFATLGLRPHDFNPKVTEHMDGIRAVISKLIENKMAYQADGDVNYSVSSFDGYGKLSGRKVEDQQAGSRIDVDEKKHNAEDFALWKSAKAGEISWPSPWGPGRPGWHIECSAMIKDIFGDQIDIHGGGMDLIFPHHENEIAQSEGCTHKQFVKYWMHWNMINFGSQKMSKSLGNIVSMREFLEVNPPEVYKWMMLNVHYRSVSDFSDDSIGRAVTGLARIYSALAVAESYLPVISGSDYSILPPEPGFEKITKEAWDKVTTALNDDFGTPEVFAALFEVTRQFNNQVRRGLKVNPAVQGKALAYRNFVHRVGALMSLFQQPAQAFLQDLDSRLLAQMKIERSAVEAVIAERTAARAAKDFAKSDELRAKLTEMGISVSDTPEGSFWEVTK
ncbi:cysteine--tRNA ligase [Bdellovibrio sp. BCCA]|uniref:cysteine--tRNA ligase n=1 Tax=Bdellovibrio sp. BCCA TaxID=3136281 RepID=UPI0030F2DE98